MTMVLTLVRPTSGAKTMLGEPLGKTAGYLNRRRAHRVAGVPSGLAPSRSRVSE